MKRKCFIITVDTEGDNLWEWKTGKAITTENVNYLQKFQELCNRYDFKPTWLSNWEMINDDRYVSFITNNLSKCEIGMHLHAVNTPPLYDIGLTEESGMPFITEYPMEVIEEKIAIITDAITSRFGVRPISHRAGRWTINNEYLSLLAKYGYQVDCSITPGIDWSMTKGGHVNSRGSDYRNECNCITRRNGIVELPVNTYRNNEAFINLQNGIKYNIREMKRMIEGRVSWLRPNVWNIKELKWVVDTNFNSDVDYLMFMIHSSELMPGGSPTFKTNCDIERMYLNLENLFLYISQKYSGRTIKEFIDEQDKRRIIDIS